MLSLCIASHHLGAWQSWSILNEVHRNVGQHDLGGWSGRWCVAGCSQPSPMEIQHQSALSIAFAAHFRSHMPCIGANWRPTSSPARRMLTAIHFGCMHPMANGAAAIKGLDQSGAPSLRVVGLCHKQKLAITVTPISRRQLSSCLDGILPTLKQRENCCKSKSKHVDAFYYLTHCFSPIPHTHTMDTT